ncbi:hypothetical protein WS65_25875 [Burkholderia anthina]|uniref:Secreted protein n=1 Tax=Burkholderia anthina TaxID=179879 RepID=A0AAW3PTH6_9BURK|nr:hypothetical protein WS65_25875 [Burkholderia anthina]KWH55638.1 hypothetical protein WT63_25105 [Burkholderia anthina]KWZ32056.1 hypothetical protein WS64_27900 [Burkholderia anthina]
MAVQREQLLIAIGILVRALVDDGRTMQVAGRIVAFTCKRPVHERRPRRAAGNFTAMFELVTFANRRLHILAI